MVGVLAAVLAVVVTSLAGLFFASRWKNFSFKGKHVLVSELATDRHVC